MLTHSRYASLPCAHQCGSKPQDSQIIEISLQHSLSVLAFAKGSRKKYKPEILASSPNDAYREHLQMYHGNPSDLQDSIQQRQKCYGSFMSPCTISESMITTLRTRTAIQRTSKKRRGTESNRRGRRTLEVHKRNARYQATRSNTRPAGSLRACHSARFVSLAPQEAGQKSSVFGLLCKSWGEAQTAECLELRGTLLAFL